MGKVEMGEVDAWNAAPGARYANSCHTEHHGSDIEMFRSVSQAHSYLDTSLPVRSYFSEIQIQISQQSVPLTPCRCTQNVRADTSSRESKGSTQLSPVSSSNIPPQQLGRTLSSSTQTPVVEQGARSDWRGERPTSLHHRVVAYRNVRNRQ